MASSRTAVKERPRFATSDWPLWSTDARIVVTDPAALGEARRIADGLFDSIDRACSRFRGDSELNRIAGRLPYGTPITPMLATLVRAALEVAHETDGAVDPTLGHALSAVGYDRHIRLVIDRGAPVKAVSAPRPGWRSVQLIGRRLRVPGHLALDFGATAKALAADLAAASIAESVGCGVLVNLGGDIATAGMVPEGGWRVLVHDLPGDPLANVTLAGGSMATSSTQKRRWTAGGVERHHILDPRTGLPVDEVWRTVTVAARNCLHANALSTAAMVLGEGAIDMLVARQVPARIVARDGSVTVLGGWPADGIATS